MELFFYRCGVASFISPPLHVYLSAFKHRVAKYILGFKSLQRNITSIYATTILRDFLKPIEVLRQPSPHASYKQISKVGLPNISSLPLNSSQKSAM